MKTFQKTAVALATLVTVGSAQAYRQYQVDDIVTFYGDERTRITNTQTPWVGSAQGIITSVDTGEIIGEVTINGKKYTVVGSCEQDNFICRDSFTLAYIGEAQFTRSVVYRGRTAAITAESEDEFNSKKTEFERSVDKQVKRLTKEAVVGAVVVNIIADEFVNPALKDEGVTAGATVGGGRDNPEVHVGVSKDLGDGVSGNVGVGTSSGNLSVGVSKSVDVNEHVRVGIGASYSDAGWAVGPSVQFHDGQGNGVGVSGVIPTITVAGYTVAVVPQLFVPNLVVIGARALYNWVKTDK